MTEEEAAVLRLAPPSPRNGVRLPPGPGRPFGSVNKAYGFIQKRCRELLESEEYIKSVKARLHNGTLAPQLEALFHHYAYGKPKDTVDVTVNQGKAALNALSADALAAEAQATAQAILAYKQAAEDQALANEQPGSESVM